MDMKYNELCGCTAFLNGESGLHQLDRELHDDLVKLGKSVLILDNLFESEGRKKLAVLVTEKVDNIVLLTTGLQPEKLQVLIEIFRMFDKTYNYRPKLVISLTENTTMALLDIYREFKPKGVNFYTLGYDDTLIEINYV